MYKKIKPILLNLGLTQNQIKIYLSLLKNNNLTISELASKIKLTRSSIYENLRSLEIQGYILKELRQKKEIYKAINIEKLTVKLAAKSRSTARMKTKLELMLPQINKWLNNKEEIPQVELFEGKRSQELIFDEIKEFSKDRILIASPDSYFTLYPHRVDTEEIKIRTEKDKQRGIINRKIITDTKFTKKVLKTGVPGVREIKVLPKDVKFKSAVTVYDNKVIIYSQKGKVFTVVLKSKVIASMMKQIFKTLWNKL